MNINLKTLATACAIITMTPHSATAENAYGGFDIVDTPGAVDQDYANVRGWHVAAFYVGGRFAFCSAGKDIGNSYMSIGFDGLQWQIAVPVPIKRGNWNGRLEIDGKSRSVSGTATQNHTIAWLGMGELDQLRGGNNANLSIGRYDYDFGLSGVTASTLKVTECVQHAGKVPAKKLAPPSSTQGQTQQQTQTNNGGLKTARAACETVFQGRFGCTLTQHPKEGSYREVITIDADDRNADRYLVKQIDDNQAEIWVSHSDQPDVWNYKGYWQPSMQDRNCIEPSPNQGLAVQDALGQDAWMLCIR